MLKIFIVLLLSTSVCVVAACSKGKDAEVAAKKASPTMSVHGDMASSANAVPGTPIADALKKKKLNAHPSKTIGEAFDSYTFASKKEWRETETKGGKFYIDYICWFDIGPLSAAALKEGVVKRGLEIKFVIHETGDAFIAMATRMDIKSDGKSYSTPIELADIEKIVAAIYENREIAL